MQVEIDEKTGEEQTEQNVIGTPSELDPFYAVRKKKKRKKKKPFPTDPDDPETDDDFEEDDDDDDDDTETSGDTEDAEDENELIQEVVKPITVQKDPFLKVPQQPENMDLKRQVDNPNKKQRSPLQKFFDVLIYGIQGAKLRNGDLSVKNSMFDELLLGLGFKAYLKDVLLNNQLVKYFKQKTKGKDDMSFLQRMFKVLKKRINKDSELKSILPDLQKKVEQMGKKSLTATIEKELQKKEIKPQKQDVIQILKTPQRPAKVGAPVPKKENIAITKEDAKKILLAVEKEEKRLKEEERRKIFEKQVSSSQVVQKESKVDVQKATLSSDQIAKVKMEQEARVQGQIQKAVQMNERATMQSEKAEMMAQRVAAPIIPTSVLVSQAEKDQAMQQQSRLNMQFDGNHVKAGEGLGQGVAKLVEVGLLNGVQGVMKKRDSLDDIVRASETKPEVMKPVVPENQQRAEATAVRVDDKGQATAISEPQKAPEALVGAARQVPTGPTNEERLPSVSNAGKGKND